MRLWRVPVGGKGRALGLLDALLLPGDVVQLGGGSSGVALR